MNSNSSELRIGDDNQEEENIGNCLDDFEILRELGGGGFGCVFKVRSKKNNKLYALKRPNIETEEDRLKNKKEIFLLKHLNHENICKCFSEFISEDGIQYMVMEQYNNQDLFEYINANKEMKRPIKEEILYNIIYQCLEGLSYIHNYGIVHCDIKLGNIFMTEEGKIVIGDFGESMFSDQKNLAKSTQNPDDINMLKFIKKFVGSGYFSAPEVKRDGCDQKTDVYSMGATFFALLYYELPVEENKEKFLNQPIYSNDLKNLIRQMIEPDKEKRIEIFKVKREFSKFYLQKYIKNSGFHSVTQCLKSFRNLYENLTSNTCLSKNLDNMDNKNNSNNTNIKKISVSLILSSIMQGSDIKTTESIEKNNLKLKQFFAPQLKINFNENIDISPLKIIFHLINALNNDLNKRNIDVNNSRSQLKNDLNKKIMITNGMNIKNVYNNFINSYKKLFSSIIAEKFLGVFKLTWTCLNCSRQFISFEKFFSITFNINSFNEQKIKIHDLFNKYNQKQIKIGLKKYISCDNCNKFTEQILNKKFYSIPNNFIILFDRGETNNSEIELKTQIQFDNQIVESSSPNPPIYTLYGIIYENHMMNENDNSQYVPLYYKNGIWYQYKYGQNEVNINLDTIYPQISKNIIALFYYFVSKVEERRFSISNSNVGDKNINNNNRVEDIPTEIVKNPKILKKINDLNNNKEFIIYNQNQQNMPHNIQNNNNMNNQNFNNNFNQANYSQCNSYSTNNSNINSYNQQYNYGNINMNMNQNCNTGNNQSNQLNQYQNNQNNFQKPIMNNNNQMNQNFNNRYNNNDMNNNQLNHSYNNFKNNNQGFYQMNNNININLNQNQNNQNSNLNVNPNNFSNQNQMSNLGFGNNNNFNSFGNNGMNNIPNNANQNNRFINFNNNTQAFPNNNYGNINVWNSSNFGMNLCQNQNMYNFNTLAYPNNKNNMNNNINNNNH